MILLAITPGQGFHRAAWRPVLGSGIDAFLIREYALGGRALLEATRWCQDTAPEVQLWVAGRLDVALAADCGLHAPEAYPSLPAGLVPLSRPLHDEDQWEACAPAHQVLASPVFPSPGKGAPWGPSRLHAFLDGLPDAGPRVLALGGVEPGHATALRHPRLAGVAAIRPFWSGDPVATVSRFRAAWA